MGGACSALARCAERPADTPSEVRLKHVIVPSYLVVGALYAILGSMKLLTPGISGVYDVAMWLAVGICILAFTLSLTTSVHPVRLVEVVVTCMVISTICLDWRAAAGMNGRMWSIAVVCMDVALVAGASSHSQNVVIGMILAWVTVEALESSLHFGVYGAAYFIRSERDGLPLICDCAEPPCPLSMLSAMSYWCGATSVFVLDYYFTRGFAVQLRRQLRLVQASSGMAERVAVLLAQYDTAEARAQVDCLGPADLPQGLRDAFLQLVENLDQYKPYLPQSCIPLASAHDEPPCSSATSQQSDDSAPIDAAAAAAAGDTSATPGSGDFASEADLYMERSMGSRRASTVLSSACSDQPAVRVEQHGGVRPAPSAVTGHVHAAVGLTKLSLLCVNRRGFLCLHAAQGDSAVQALLTADVASFVASTAEHKGVVDLLSADHRFASFNAVPARRCPQHRLSAVRCANALLGDGSAPAHDAPLTAAACSALALCGDFGTSEMRRFMVIGRLSSLLLAAERCAAHWGARIACDSAVRADADLLWECRLRVYLVLKGMPEMTALWELRGERRPAGDDVLSAGPAEWMYELDELADDRWSTYNAIMASWAAGNGEQAAARIQEAVAQTGDPAVAMALEQLAQSVAAGDHPVQRFADVHFEPMPGVVVPSKRALG